MTCPTNPEHGAVYEVALNRWYCPHSDHDKGDRSRCLFPTEEVMAGHVKPGVRLPTTRKRGRKRRSTSGSTLPEESET